MKSALNSALFGRLQNSLRTASRFELGALFVGFLLFVVIVVRSIYVPITIDEASTFLEFVNRGNLTPPFAKWEANNHLLNTFLTFVFTRFLGDELWVLRLANVISFPAYLFFLNRLLSRVSHLGFRIVLSVVLCMSTMVIELFSFSRGYGMSFAWMMGVLYFIQAWTETRSSRTFWLGALMALLMLLSNLNLLPFFIIVLGYQLFISESWNERIKLGAIGLVLGGAFIFYGIELKNRGLLYYGADDFFAKTVEFSAALFVGSFDFWWISLLAIVPIMIVLINGLRHRENSLRSFITEHFVVLAFLGVMLITVVQHYVLGTPWPQDRTAAHFFILFVLAGASAEMQRASFVVIGLIALIVLFGFSKKSLTMRSSIWAFTPLPNCVVEELMAFQTEAGRVPTIGTTYEVESVWNYMNFKSNTAFITQALGEGRAQSFDFILAKEGQVGDLNSNVERVCGADNTFQLHRNPAVDFSKTSRLLELWNNTNDKEFNKVLDTVWQDPTTAIINSRIHMSTEDLSRDVFLVYKEEGTNEYVHWNLCSVAGGRTLKESVPLELSRVVAADRAVRSTVYIWNPERVQMGLDSATTIITSL